MLNRCFLGRYKYCAPYSPELKPVEKGFSNVKSYIRERDNDHYWQSHPLELIEEAFEYYSIRAESGSVAENHFRIYYDNNNYYKQIS